MKNICFCSLSGEVVTRCDCNYEELRQMWNRAIQKYPIAIVYCEDYYDVSNAILWAKEECVPIRIRAGGHNYEGYSTGDNVLVIDLSEMKNISINNEQNTVTIGAGVNNGQMYNFVSREGYPFPGGTCPTVYLGGYCTGGGWGLSSRKLGLGCDSLLEIGLIDYKGELVIANSYKNEDLFWAIRGAGGGNYGVIVYMTFKLPKKVGNVTLFRIDYNKTNINIQCNFFDIWQRWINVVDNDINTRVSIYNSLEDGIGISVIGLCYKNPYETQNLLNPFLEIQGAKLSLQYLSFLEATNEIGKIYPPYEYFKSTGRFANRYFSLGEIRRMLSIVNSKRPEGSTLISINMYGLGGKVAQVNRYDTAFYYRDARYILLIQTVFENNCYKKVNDEWINYEFPYIYNLTNGSYVNFPYNKLCNYKFDYYGENVFRLEYVKRKYDPYNVFTFPQGIGN